MLGIRGTGERETGAALLITLGTLTLLLSLGSAFVVNMITENRQTENFVRALQARSAAQAGLERAVAELRLAAETSYAAASNQPWFYRSAAQPSYRRSGSADSGLLGTSARYTLRVTDAASRIYLDDQNPNLASMLEGLPALGTALSSRIITTRGNAMPNGRYAVKSQVKLVSGIGDTTFQQFSNFVTAQGYVDPNTMDLLSGGATPTYQNSPRAPVNVNTASREVLIAAMAPYLSDAAEAGRVADDLIARQGRAGSSPTAMATWQDYAQWQQGVRGRLPGITLAEERNLRDNVNPNRKNAWAMTSSTTPRAKYATEFCFHSGGIYEIESTGQAVNPGGNVLASVTLATTVPIYKILNWTKKEQFRGEDRDGDLTLDLGEDTNGNGVLDAPQFNSVNWMDSCPVDSNDERDIGYAINYQKINDSLKLGFWDDFDEDPTFSQAVFFRKTPDGASFNIENSDASDQDKELHHATTKLSTDKGYKDSRHGKVVLSYGILDNTPPVGLRCDWQFYNAYIRADVLEDTTYLQSSEDTSFDNVAQLGFRAYGSTTFQVYGRYPPGVHWFVANPSRAIGVAADWRLSSIWRPTIPAGADWKRDAYGNPQNKAAIDVPLSADYTVHYDLDGGKLPLPIQERRRIRTWSDANGSWEEFTIKYPPRVVFDIPWSNSSLPASTYNGNDAWVGPGRIDKFVFGDVAGNQYQFFPRRTYHLWLVNRLPDSDNENDVLTGVRLRLSSDTGAGIENRPYPDSGGSFRQPPWNTAGTSAASHDYVGEVNTVIQPSGTLALMNAGGFVSWDNIRIITPVGEYQWPMIDMGTTNVRWGTLAWTLTIPASATSFGGRIPERVSFEAFSTNDRNEALRRKLRDKLYDPLGGGPDTELDIWPIRKFVGRVQDNIVIGSGMRNYQTRGRLDSSGSALVGKYPTEASPNASFALWNTDVEHGQQYLVLKAWLTSERFADLPPTSGWTSFSRNPDPSWDDAKHMRETPVLEDVTLTYIPRTRIGGYREGPG